MNKNEEKKLDKEDDISKIENIQNLNISPHKIPKININNNNNESIRNKLSYLILTITVSFSIFPNLALTFFF